MGSEVKTVTDVDGGPSSARPRAVGLPTVDPSLYEVGYEIAQGGMGRIRTAIDLRLGREVAIKEVLEPRGELATRFEREAILTARLQHPSIVAVYEAGRWPTGEPFYAMRLVPGQSLKKVISSCKTYVERLALLPNVIAIADAMAYAHDQHIIHRDLKPANVLVGDFGETVVIDWGLGKDLDASENAGEAQEAQRISSGDITVAGSIVGTPNYMPPEQAAAQPVDERADVYAIGALLYHVLAGEPPYVGQTAREIIAKVVSEAPRPVTAHEKSIPSDLVAIVERAMARDVARRYPTARELAQDLKRFQTGQLVASHRYSRRELVSRFIRRYRTALAITGVAAILVAAVGIVAVQRIRRERDVSVAEKRRADRERGIAEAQRATAVERADSFTIEQAASLVERDPRKALELLAGLSPESPQWAAARVIAADAAARGIPHVLYRASSEIESYAISPDGKQLAIADETHTISMVDVATGDTRKLGTHRDVVDQLELSKDGRSLVSQSKDRDVSVWDVATGTVRTFTHDTMVLGSHVSSMGGYAITIDFTKRARVWNVASGAAVLDVITKQGMMFLDDNDHAPRVIYATDRGFHIVEIATGKKTLLRERSSSFDDAAGVYFSSNKLHAAVTKQDGTVAVYDVASGTERVLGKHGTNAIYAPRFTPDDTAILTAGDGELRLWPLDGGKPRLIGVQPERDSFTYLAVSPSGHHAITFGPQPRLWDLDTGAQTALVGPPAGARSLQFTPDGSAVLGISANSIWTWPTQRPARVVERRGAAVRTVAWIAGQLATNDASAIHIGAESITIEGGIVGRQALSPDHTRVALLGGDGHVHVVHLAPRRSEEIFDVQLETARRKFPADPPYQRTTGIVSVRRYTRSWRDRDGWFDPVVFSPDGTQLAAAGTQGGIVHVYTAPSGKPAVFDLGTTDVEQLVFAPDGKTLFVAGSDSKAHVIPLDGGSRRTLKHDGVIEAMVVSRDGKTLYTASVDRMIRAWDLTTFTARVIGKHRDIVTALLLTPDGKHLVSAGQRKQIEIWDLATPSASSVTLEGLTDNAIGLALSRDGSRLVAGDTKGMVRMWDLASHRGRDLQDGGAPVGVVTFSDDGTRVLAGDERGALLEFTDSLPTDETGLRRWLADALR